jgi:hypothetical protein
MSRFDAIRTERVMRVSAVSETPTVAATASRSPARIGKKAVSGYFSPDLSRALHLLALEQGTNLQSLMGEAFDDLMRKYGKHPFGES